MEAKAKAGELVNLYYDCNARTQREAIEQAEEAVLCTICQKVDDLYINVVQRGDMDENFVKPGITVLKWWQEVAVELGKLKNALPV